jgi:hypothetical protein
MQFIAERALHNALPIQVNRWHDRTALRVAAQLRQPRPDSNLAFNTRAEAKAGDRFTAAALTLPKFLDAITRKTKTLRKLEGGTSWNFGRPFYSG